MNDIFEYDCKCPNCGFKKNLGHDEVDCNEVPCPKCDFPALVDFKEQINTPETLEESVYNNLYPKKDSNKYICEHCKTIISKQLYESQNGQCPKCSEDTIPLFEDISLNEKRMECLTCHTSYLYDRFLESCEVCQGKLYTYAATNFKKEKNTSIPMGE